MAISSPQAPAEGKSMKLSSNTGNGDNAWIIYLEQLKRSVSELEEDRAWLEHRERFAQLCNASSHPGPVQSFIMRAGRRLAEKPFGPQDHFQRVIEIGVGTGEHLPYVRHGFDEYVLTDTDAKTLAVAGKKLGGLHLGKLRFEIQTPSGLSYPDDSFDRLVATHVLEHIQQPHLALKEWSRVLKPEGVLSILIPTDPGMAWRLGRHMGPRKAALAQGIAYDYVMAREHVNSCSNLIAILRHYFRPLQEAWWPLPFASIDLNLFFAFHAKVARRQGAK
jgi:phosphatidylethanolamine/phosphatidyl-N-methylethanolamine N-methyltransferase